MINEHIIVGDAASKMVKTGGPEKEMERGGCQKVLSHGDDVHNSFLYSFFCIISILIDALAPSLGQICDTPRMEVSTLIPKPAFCSSCEFLLL